MQSSNVQYSPWTKTGKSLEPLYDDKGKLSSANTVHEESRKKITSGIFSSSTEPELRNISSQFRYNGKYGDIAVLYKPAEPREHLGYFDDPASEISLLVKDKKSNSENPSFYLKLYKHDNAMLNTDIANGSADFFDELYSLTNIKSVSIKKESIPTKILKHIMDETDAPSRIVFTNDVKFY